MDRLSEIRARCEAFEDSNDSYKGVLPQYILPVLADDGYSRNWAEIAAHSHEDIPYLLARIEKAEVENRWIPMGERLPDNGIDVLLYWSNDAQNKKYVDIERYHIDHWETLDRPWIRAIAWMPLPEPPKGT